MTKWHMPETTPKRPFACPSTLAVKIKDWDLITSVTFDYFDSD